jgi:N-acetylglutamate synthase-like GNAT family acetyltransferase
VQLVVSITSLSRIRIARPADLPAVRRLIGDQLDEASLSSTRGQRYVLVLDAREDGLAAVAVLHIERPRGHIALLVIDDRFEDDGVAARMLGVAEGLAEAFGCETLDVPANRHAA